MSTVYNPGTSPVRLDDEGHVLGGRERCDVPASDRVQSLLDKGFLIEVESSTTDEKEG